MGLEGLVKGTLNHQDCIEASASAEGLFMSAFRLRHCLSLNCQGIFGDVDASKLQKLASGRDSRIRRYDCVGIYGTSTCHC